MLTLMICPSRPRNPCCGNWHCTSAKICCSTLACTRRSRKTQIVLRSGTDQIYVGHSRVRAIRQLGNTTFIDTGNCFENGSLSLIDLHTQASWIARLHECP
ncbi:hypothetical protein D3C78_501660 [compost metagenome]